MDIESILHWLRVTPDWGNVPAWLALTAAIIVGGFTGKSLGIARKTRKDDVDERHRAQAATVAVWVMGRRIDPPGDPNRVHVASSNTSGIPVFTVTIWWRIRGQIGRLIELPTLTPTQGTGRVETDATEELNELQEYYTRRLYELRQAGELHVGMRFRDAAGVWWYRDWDGVLSEGYYSPDPSDEENIG